MCRSFFFQMLVIYMSGFFQGYIVSRAHSSWFVILHKNPADDSIVSELGLEAPVIGSEEYISKEELSLTPVTVKKWTLFSTIYSQCHVWGGLRIRGHLLSASSYAQCCIAALSQDLWVLKQRRQLEPVEWPCSIDQTGGTLLSLLWSGMLKWQVVFRKAGLFLKCPMYVD